MSKQGCSFSPEFKLDAAHLVVDQGYPISEAARSLDVGTTVIRRWGKQLESERSGETPANKAITPEQQRVQELEARINRLDREKEILKKATALLMSDEINRTCQ
ncbi:transposase [Microbulbifer agarilyticus]|uniref:transposase n=1 Tax=Microbulbifer agarilyticus TaxID=260552 RepID=UPI001CD205DD|nr:transposase [Microbulbifer agarilyticus]MCA0901926.1 transposase [Microbulbifer agarilyticus]